LDNHGSEEFGRQVVPNIRKHYKGYHPLLVLIYMLLIADIVQAASFVPNLVWTNHNAIEVRTETCWAQGWLRSQGDSECCWLMSLREWGVLTPNSGEQPFRSRRLRQHMADGGQKLHHSKQDSLGCGRQHLVI